MLEPVSELPAVAVCIPAFDEVEGIATTLRSIWATGYPRDRLEVVVAVDGGDERVCTSARAEGANVVVVSPNQGSYAARNAAVDALRSVPAALLFTDADCVVSAEWITGHLGALQHADLSGGAVRFLFSGSPPRPAEWIDSLRHLKQEFYVNREGFAATCNLAVSSTAFEALRFDPALRSGGDADFGIRAKAAGYSLVYTAAAGIDHLARPTRRALFTKVRRVAGGAPHIRALRGNRDVPTPRLTLGAYRKARADGLRVGLLWGVEACLLDYAAQRIIRAEIQRQTTTGTK